MSAPVSPVGIRAVPEIRIPDGVNASGSRGEFQSILASAIGGVDKLRGEAAKSVERLLAGDGEEVHTVALATQRAELAFELFLQVRNKVVSAYQAVMQMQV